MGGLQVGEGAPLITLILAPLLIGLGAGLVLEEPMAGALAGLGTGLIAAAFLIAGRSPYAAFTLSLLGTLSILGALTLMGSLKIPAAALRVAGAAALVTLGVVIIVKTMRR